MPGAPTVVVLLAAYNGRTYLEEQLRSIVDQQNVEIRIVASVDQSDDGTEEWLRTRAVEEPRLTVLPSAGRLGSASANFFRLVSEAPIDHHHYVAFADQDDIWLPDKLARAVRMLRANGSDGYSSDVLGWAPGSRPRLIRKSGKQRDWDYLFSSPGPGCTHVLSARLARLLKDVVTQRPDIVSRIEYHDWLDYALARSHGLEWTIDPVPSMLYRQHTTNQIGANQGPRAAVRRLKMLRAEWLWTQTSLIAEACAMQEALPVRLLADGSLASRLRFLALAKETRRRRLDAALVGLSALVR